MLFKFKQQLKNKGELYLCIKARPGADKTAVKEIMEDETVKINIVAPPVNGKANQELIKFLAKEFDISKNNVKIVSGERERIKLIHIIHM